MKKPVKKSKLRVVIILWSGNYGGVERSIQWFAQRADQTKFDYYFIFLHRGGYIHDVITALGFPTFVLGWKNGFSLSGRLNLMRIILKIKPDLIHDQEQTPLIRVFMKMATRVPIISTQHGFFPYTKRDQNALFYRIDDRVTTLVIANSDFTAQKHSEYFNRPLDKMKIIYLGINPDDYREVNHSSLTNVDKTRMKIVFIGRLEYFKGALQIPFLAKALKGYGLDFILSVIGEGPLLDECKGLVSELNLQEHIRFLGWQSNVAEILQKSDALVSLSLCDESFGFVPLEALASGLPVFAYRSGAMVEILDKAPCARLVAKGDFRRMAQLLCEYRSNHKLCDGYSGYLYVKEKFDIQKTVTETEQLYVEIGGTHKV